MMKTLGWKLPDPWDISVIKPVMHFYIVNKTDPLIKSYDESPEKVIGDLKDAGYISMSYFYGATNSGVVFITHGFENDVHTPWLPEMKDAILTANPTALVALVGWSGGAEIGVLKYSQAAANTQSVGAWLSSYIAEFRKVSSSWRIWGIGHSLGAHLLGLAGRASQAFDRISGLDPAGPSFEKVNQENRLCKTDAKIVDVIHTDGYDTAFDPADWFAPVNHYGTLIPLGTVDFYPNFGFRQPGLPHFVIAGSHHRSIELFTWSILNPGRFATNEIIDGVPHFESPVEKIKYSVEKAEMGYHYDGKTNGLFYIQTAGSEPWKEEKRQEEEEESEAEQTNEANSWCVIS